MTNPFDYPRNLFNKNDMIRISILAIETYSDVIFQNIEKQDFR